MDRIDRINFQKAFAVSEILFLFFVKFHIISMQAVLIYFLFESTF